MELARSGNKYLADTEPWKLFKSENGQNRTETILNISVQVIASLSILCEPFMPFSAEKLKNMLDFKSDKWTDATNINAINPGHLLNKPSLLFQKIEDEEIENQTQKLKN